MSAKIDAPLEWVETVGDLRLQELMDRNNDGLLSEAERADLESLVEPGERVSLVRVEALHLLGRKPRAEVQVGAETVPLFDPRVDDWNEHFGWDGYHITGLTPKGQATVNAIVLNHERRVRIRWA